MQLSFSSISIIDPIELFGVHQLDRQSLRCVGRADACLMRIDPKSEIPRTAYVE